MKNLVIFMTADSLIFQDELDRVENPITLDGDLIEAREPIDVYGRRWAELYPNDIVMLVEED